MNFQLKMAPNHHFILNSLPLEPVSRTYQYRKIMKPMLERKRRARINKCLDELKDLMTGTLQADGENVSKLEKADILELTVRHLHRLRENNALFLRNSSHHETLSVEKFWAGFQHCAAEVSQFLNKYDRSINNELIKHITNYIPNMSAAVKMAAVAAATAPITTAAAATKATANYQRFPTTINQFNQTAAATATAASATAMCNKTAYSSVSSTATTMKPIVTPTAQFYRTTTTTATTTMTSVAKMKFHPYARTFEVGGDGDANDIIAIDGGVWRPW